MPEDLSFLDLVDICDNVHLYRDAMGLYDRRFNSEHLIPLCLSDEPTSAAIGLLRPQIVQQLQIENEESRKKGVPELWKLRVQPPDFIRTYSGVLGPNVSFATWVDTPSKRTAAMKELCERWRDTGLFSDVCGPTKWRAEMYPIYADPFGVHDHPLTAGHEENLNYAFEMERSACALFGAVTYGVHLSVYDEATGDDGQKGVRVWVPRRALTKPTYPGMLDNTVAGGIPSGMPVFEALVKECQEEASFEMHLVRQHARSVGSISYFIRRFRGLSLIPGYSTSQGWLQPEVEYVYDIVIPADESEASFIPRPMDGEVESFEFVTHGMLLHQLRSGLFKPNCGLVIIDLLLRLGYITPDNEPNFMKIINRLHGSFGYDKW